MRQDLISHANSMENGIWPKLRGSIKYTKSRLDRRQASTMVHGHLILTAHVEGLQEQLSVASKATAHGGAERVQLDKKEAKLRKADHF